MANTPLYIPSLVERGKFHDYRKEITGDSFNWSWNRSTNEVEFVVIHHSAGPASQTPEEIAKFHVNSRKWGGVGYHFIITPDGMVHYVGDVGTARANVADKNEKVIGVNLVGDFTKHLPTDDQIRSAHDLCKFLIFEAGVWPKLKGWDQLVGHKDLQATACPGSSWPNDMRDRIINNIPYTAQPTPDPKPEPKPDPKPEPTPTPTPVDCSEQVEDARKEGYSKGEEYGRQQSITEFNATWGYILKEANAKRVSVGLDPINLSTPHEFLEHYHDIVDELIKEKEKTAVDKPYTFLDKLQSTKLHALLGSLIGIWLPAMNGLVDYNTAITSTVVVALGYMGFNVADTVAYSKKLEAQAKLMKAQPEQTQ